MADLRTVADLDIADKRVIIRADLNVPMSDGAITNDSRIQAVAPTIRALSDRGARVIVLSHFGRPNGRIVPALSLKFVAAPLAGILGMPVAFATDCVGPEALKVVAGLGPGGVALLENVRFHDGEESNDPAFARELAELGDAYVNDAFSAAHRAHASTEGIARLLPAAAGPAMAAEISALEDALDAPQRPVAAIVAGAKISTKLEVLGNLIAKMDVMIIGGAMANTFLHARGVAVGGSLCEHDLAATARQIMARADGTGCEIILPVDAVVAKELKPGADCHAVDIGAVGGDDLILDIGPRSISEITKRLGRCRTLLWNGPLGAFEVPPFDAGTTAVARAAAALTMKSELLTVAGGGDTAAALRHAGVAGHFSHVSTAGGAFLEWLEGRTLPGVRVLSAP